MINIVILTAYAVILAYSKTKDSLLILLSFFASLVYVESSAFAIHASDTNHLVISLFFLPAFLLCTKWVSVASLCYTIFHWLVSGEYLFFSDTEILIGVFYELAISINLLIMVALCYERYNHNYHKNSLLADSWIINLCIHRLQIFSNKKRGGQC